ncbi:MAG: hypothetical protein DRO36_01080 [Candidatus Hecatellales archaeon]|nr:MAG: hypothetical protein DRO36_01080 [Candidatus Hecatellales archaeon]
MIEEKEKLLLVGLIVLALIGGVFVGIFIQGVFTPKPKPITPCVGIIDIYGPIVSVGERDYILRMVDYTLKNDTIKAVVLKIDTPGGYVDFVQDIYLSLLKLRNKKPLVASVSFGPSGGYYIAVAANHVYVTPQAIVGNIGVIGFLPPKPSPRENIVETGPYKLTGFPVKEYPFMVKEALNTFLDTVEKERGVKLKIGRTELSKALLYFGYEAVKYGLADGLGSTVDAVEKAAKLANLTTYEVVDVSSIIKPPTEKHKVSSIADLKNLHTPPALYYIYIPSSAKTSKGEEAFNIGKASSLNITGKTILVDLSHGNAFKPYELNILTSEIVSRGFNVQYVYSFENMSSWENVSALVIISPTKKFTFKEVNLTRVFVRGGGKLLLFFEPTRTTTSEINMIANVFGLVFSNGYLYNLKENYGNYRNIIIKNFAPVNLTKGLREVVFFTTTYICGGEKVCWTSNNTYSSESGYANVYPPIALAYKGRVLAIGDQTFLTEPYCYIKDNYRLIKNVAAFLTSNQTKILH